MKLGARYTLDSSKGMFLKKDSESKKNQYMRYDMFLALIEIKEDDDNLVRLLVDRNYSPRDLRIFHQSFSNHLRKPLEIFEAGLPINIAISIKVGFSFAELHEKLKFYSKAYQMPPCIHLFENEHEGMMEIYISKRKEDPYRVDSMMIPITPDFSARFFGAISGLTNIVIDHHERFTLPSMKQVLLN